MQPSYLRFSTCICADIYALTSEPFSLQRYADDRFYGIMVDTGCSLSSTAGMAQYLAYCKHVGIPADIDEKRQTDCRFGIGTTRSKGVARITLPFNGINLFYDAHVVDGDVPLRFSLADMHNLHFKNITNQLYHIPCGTSVTIIRQFGHPFYLWQPMLHTLFAEIELRRLHRRFGQLTSSCALRKRI